MEFKVEISLNAQEDIEIACEYYKRISNRLNNRFLDNLAATYLHLSRNPNYRIRYKNFRAIPIPKFPFLLFFTVDEEHKTVNVLSCFQTAQDPKKYPK